MNGGKRYCPDFIDHVGSYAEVLMLRAKKTPDQPLYIYLEDGENESVRLTYRDMDQKAKCIASALLSVCQPGDRALLLYLPDLEYIAGFMGCLYAGVIAVPAYPPDPSRLAQTLPKLKAVATDSGAKIALSTKMIIGFADQLFGTEPDLKNLNWLATDDLDPATAAHWKARVFDRRDLAFLQYTSGSTGVPKGVMVSNGNLLENAAIIQAAFEDTPETFGVSWLPPYHDMGLIGGILQPLWLGVPSVLMSPMMFLQKPLRWLSAISKYRATTSGGPNFAYDLCVRKVMDEERQNLDLSSWTMAFNGAEPVREETLNRFAETFADCGFRKEAFYPCYGMAETTLFVSGGKRHLPPKATHIDGNLLLLNKVKKSDTPENDSNRTLMGCGHPKLSEKVVVVDPSTQVSCPEGEIGEIWVSGPNVTQGYWNKHQETEYTFNACLADTGEGPFLRTGDLGFIENNEIFVSGRIKDMIIIRGRNYYPQDIESAAENSHPGLRPGCGAAFSVDINGKEGVAIVYEVRNADVDPEQANQIIAAMHRSILENESINMHAIYLLAPKSIPKTSSGKLRRHACKAAFLDGSLETVATWRDIEARPLTGPRADEQPNDGSAPESESVPAAPMDTDGIRTWLKQKLAAALRISPEEIKTTTPFSRFGLDSAEAVGLAGDLEKWLGKRIAPTIAYDYPTIEDLAAHLCPESDLRPDATGRSLTQISENQSIAIVGMGCRFPGADSPEDFWQLIMDQAHAVSEVPPDRWNKDDYYAEKRGTPGKMNTKWGGFLNNVDQFDPRFFGISPREATHMDPQQRLLMEVTWEALENAGIPANKLNNTNTGVFVGISASDYSRMHFHSPASTDAYAGPGNALCISANRISYWLNLHGPSWAVDTACSSSLVALHQACRSLRTGECDAALAGGVNMILTPQITISFSQAGMMAEDGRCKSFDADADGYVRGEGCGVVILKRFADALADGDEILAVIRGSAVNQDGRSNSLTAPSGPAQQAVLRTALADAGVAASQLSYIEAHGTGTAIGDPIELGSLKAVIAEDRLADDTCFIGSVKSNIGHLEAASGMASLIKTIMSLNHGMIPPNIHYNTPTPHVSLENAPLTVPTRAKAWPEGKRRLAGISSFGFGGTNAHIIIEEAPVKHKKKDLPERPYHLLTLSAKNDAALRDLAERYAGCFMENPDMIPADICFRANAGKTHFSNRLGITAASVEDMVQKLKSFADNEVPAGACTGIALKTSDLPVTFVFTGQGSQYSGMAGSLFDTQPMFRQAILECADVLDGVIETNLLDILFAGPDAEDEIHQTDNTQPALFSVEYALARMWQSWGIVPKAVMGHSVGEYVAACIAGVFSLEDGLRLIAARGQLMQALPTGGAMAAVLGKKEQVETVIETYDGKVCFAAFNGPNSVVISGDQTLVEAAVADLKEAGTTSKQLTVSHAFHSPLMEPMIDEFLKTAHTVTYHLPTMDLISNRTGQTADAQIATPEYWCRHILEPVHFEDSMKSLYEQGIRIFLECGPDPVLLGMGRRCIEGKDCRWLPSLRKGRSDWMQICMSLSELYIAGADIDWESVDQPFAANRVRLPNYPFQRKRYWIDDGQVLPSYAAATPKTTPNGIHPLVGQAISSAILNKGDKLFETVITPHTPSYLKDHKIFDNVIFPAAGYLEMAMAAGCQALQTERLSVENVAFHRAMFLDENEPRTLQMVLSTAEDSGYEFKIFSRRQSSGGEVSETGSHWALHADGRICAQPSSPSSSDPGNDEEPVLLGQIRESFAEEIPVADFYAGLRRLGLNYGLKFRGIEKMWRRNGNALGKIRLPLKSDTISQYYVFPPSLLDACFQSLAGVMNDKTDATLLPVGIEKMEIIRPNTGSLWCRTGEIRPSESQTEFKADLDVMDENGRPSAMIKGLTLRKVRAEMFSKGKQKSVEDWLYDIKWEKMPTAQTDDLLVSDEPGCYIVLGDRTELGEKIIQKLEQLGVDCIRVISGSKFQWNTGTNQCVVNPKAEEDFDRLIQTAAKREIPIKGIVHLWSLDLPSHPGDDPGDLLGCENLLYLVKTLAAAGLKDVPRLFIMTRGSQAVKTEDRISVCQSPVWGLGRVISLEHPSFKCTRIDLDPSDTADDYKLAVNTICHPEVEDQVAFRQGDRYVARLARYDKKSVQTAGELTIPESASFRMAIKGYGMLENLYLAPFGRSVPGPDDVEIRVCASGLNFRDVLNALGMLKEVTEKLGIESAEDLPFGGECAGVVTSVGENVNRFSPGNAVLAAFAVGSLGKYVNVNQAYVASKPEQLTFEEAATLPITYLTAWYGLHHLAKIKSGERVLIHAAAGGVGQAAVRIAQQAGAEIYTTASPGKWDFLKSMGICHVMNSRTLDFEKQIAEKTGGKGVDIVFNSLNGDFIEKSVTSLKHGGRFVEIGKIGIWDEEQMHARRPDIAYFPFDLIDVSCQNPDAITDMLDVIMERVEKNEFSPLPLKTFPVQKSADAFRFMAQARHIGKVVITFPESSGGETASLSPIVDKDASYLITGGYGALGLKVAAWLAEKGARHLVLAGRRGPSLEARTAIDALTAQDIQVMCARADISNKTDIAVLLESIKQECPPLKGIVHAAGTLNDALLVNMPTESFARVMAPKVAGAWNLHEMTETANLDFFVLFSSAAALLGSPGQGNYAAANAFMDGLAHFRRQQGLPALSINWGPWAGSGMAAELESKSETGSFFSGMDLIPTEQGIDLLERLLIQNATQAGVLPVDWPVLLNRFAKNAVPPVFKDFEDLRDGSGSATPPLLKELIKALPINRSNILSAHLRDRVAKILELESVAALDPEQPLKEMGLDSLMAVELNNIIQNDITVSLTAENFMENPSLNQLSDVLLQRLVSEGLLADGHQESASTVVSVSTGSNGWVAYRKEKTRAEVRLFCFHHMGGAASMFRTWADDLPETIDVCPIQLPGREGRRNEKPLTCFDTLINTLSDYLAPYLNKPFAFFGHSMGTLVAYELAHAISQKHGQLPEHLFMAAMTPPSENEKLIREGLIVEDSILKHMEVPEPLRGDSEFMNGWLNLFKADSNLFKTYRYHEKPVLDCPISVFGGTEDALVGRTELSWWAQHTGGDFNLLLIPGKHMFPVESKALLLAEIQKELTRLVHEPA